MREQMVLRIALAASALVCSLNFFPTRESIDLVAAGLFALVTHSTGRPRGGAFLGAAGATAAVLAIRIHQYLTGRTGLSILFVLNLFLPAAALVLALLALRKLTRNQF